MKIEIRVATKEDSQILIMFRYLLMQYDSNLDSTVQYNVLALEKSSRYMKDYLTKKNNFYLIASLNEIPIGYLHTTFDDIKNKQLSYLSELYVLDIFRDNKVGEQLINYHFNELKKKKIVISELTTAREKNKKTIRFYKKQGYKIIKEESNTVYMRKEG